MDVNQWIPMTDDVEGTYTLFTSIKQSLEDDLQKGMSLDPADLEDKIRQMNDLILAMERHSDISSESKQRIDECRSALRDLENEVTKITGPIVYPIETNSEPAYDRSVHRKLRAMEQQGTLLRAANDQIQMNETVGEDILHNVSRQRETVLLAGSIPNDSQTIKRNYKRFIRRIRQKVEKNKVFFWCCAWLFGFLIFFSVVTRISSAHSSV